MDAKAPFLAVVVVLFPAVCPAQVPSQPVAMPRTEVVGSVGLGRLFRVEDRAFGNHVNVGAGVSFRLRGGLYAGVDVDRTLGLSPAPVSCGSIHAGPGQAPLPCTGSARQGPSEATVASVTAHYYFTTGRVRPFVTGGLSIVRANEIAALAIIRQDTVQYSEYMVRDTGAGLTLGGGLRIAVTRAISVRTEMRLAGGSALSGSNLNQFRLSTGVAYGW